MMRWKSFVKCAFGKHWIQCTYGRLLALSIQLMGRWLASHEIGTVRSCHLSGLGRVIEAANNNRITNMQFDLLQKVDSLWSQYSALLQWLMNNGFYVDWTSSLYVCTKLWTTRCEYPWAKYHGSGFIDGFQNAFYTLNRTTLHWRHNDQDGGSNHQPHGCLLNRAFRCRSKQTSKLRVTGLCVGNSPGPANSPHKGPVTRKMFPFDDVIMIKAVQ